MSHSHRRYRERGLPDPEKLPQIGLESDLEQKQNHPELGQNMDDVGRGAVRRNDAQHALPQQDTGNQLTEDRGLANSLGQFAEELGRNQHRGQD